MDKVQNALQREATKHTKSVHVAKLNLAGRIGQYNGEKTDYGMLQKKRGGWEEGILKLET